MPNIIDAIKSLRPNAEWEIIGNDYENLVWKDAVQSKPTKSELEAEALRLKPIIECQQNRAKAYPSIVDQLDTLYHGGFDAWKATIDAVKNQYPKP